MRHLGPALALASAAAVLSAAGGSLAGVALSDEEARVLASGGIVVQPLPGSGEGSTVAGASFALVDAPPEKVWRSLVDVRSWPAVFPNTFEAEEVIRHRNASAVRMVLGNRLFRFQYYLTVTRDEQKRTLRYRLNKKKPHDIGEARGYVRLFPQPNGRTLVAFTALVEVPFAPIVALMGDDVIRVLERRVLSVPHRLKRWVELR